MVSDQPGGRGEAQGWLRTITKVHIDEFSGESIIRRGWGGMIR